jgi:basic membrane lipoprotein Med (substrate-binding protein (PBP1-ABC) superfamily)
LQDGSSAGRVKVSYLAVAGPQAVGNATPYANTLPRRRCSLVIAVRKSQVDAVAHAAPDHPEARFAVVGGHVDAGNVVTVPDGAVRSSVAGLVEGLAR